MAHTAGAERRLQLKARYWRREIAWDGSGSGWFKAPRTLPLLLTLLAERNLTSGLDISRVYLELLARHMDSGLIEMGNEADHAYAAGYTGGRSIRSWVERMEMLEKLGFIKTKQVGNQRYRLVLLVDPLVAVVQLREKGIVPDSWWEAYTLRLIETKEADLERVERLAERGEQKQPKRLETNKKRQ
jgi:hypothetical protein